MPPKVTGTQNHIVFAAEFLKGAGEAFASLEQGGDPHEVYAFVDVLGPSIVQHLQGAGADPTRGDMVHEMQKRWASLAMAHDKLGKALEAQAVQEQQGRQTMQRAQSIQEGTDPEFMLKASETKAKMDMQAGKTRHQMQLRQEAANQKLAINDLSAASKITISNAEATAKMRNGAKETDSE